MYKKYKKICPCLSSAEYTPFVKVGLFGVAVWGIVQDKIAGIAVFTFGTPLGMISS